MRKQACRMQKAAIPVQNILYPSKRYECSMDMWQNGLECALFARCSIPSFWKLSSREIPFHGNFFQGNFFHWNFFQQNYSSSKIILPWKLSSIFWRRWKHIGIWYVLWNPMQETCKAAETFQGREISSSKIILPAKSFFQGNFLPFSGRPVESNFRGRRLCWKKIMLEESSTKECT